MKLGTPSYLVDNADGMQRDWFEGAKRVGVTAGASAPDILVQGVIARLQTWGGRTAQEAEGKRESVVFSLPKNLLRAANGNSTDRE